MGWPTSSIADETAAMRRALFAVAGPALGSMLLLPPLLGFSVDFASFLPLLTLAAIPALVLPYARWRGLDALRAPLEATALGLVLTLPAIVFSFSAIRLGLPLADPALIRMDAALGFDWPSFVRLLDRSATLSWLLALAYDTFSLQLLFLPTILCLAGLPARAYRFILCYALLTAIAAMFGALLPSEGTFVAYGFGPETLSNLDSKFGFLFLTSFHAVRDNPDFILSLATAAGIMSFPSVHAGVALLCAWAAWPSRWLRAPLFALNAAMTIGAIPYGAHYLVDIIAGSIIATLAIALSGRLAIRLRRSADGAERLATLAVPARG